MIGYSFQTSIANILIECVGIFFFYIRLDKKDGRKRYFGFLWLLLLLFVYVPIIPEMSSSKAFALSNLFNQLIRTCINIMAIYGYLRFTVERNRTICLYLSSVYVLIYMVSFNLRQACNAVFLRFIG